MPRSTAKSRKNNVTANTCNISTINSATTTPTKNAGKPPSVRRGRAIKKETETATETVTEQVFHRKSERRRVARDIFLVFEEQPSSRRSGRTNKKHITKPKFGHLKVEDPIKSKGLLRDIKNEPKCYLSSSSNTIKTALAVAKNNKKKEKEMCVQSENKLNSEKFISIDQLPSASATYSTNNNVATINITTAESKKKAVSDTLPLVARVNPIFLWVKQEDTRIVEVRCEDYDKRNRIRITKTSNGWRAIPRSDPTSSKVLKFYPTPLMKVKRENNLTHHETNNNNNSLIIEKIQSTAAVANKYHLSQNILDTDVDVLVNKEAFKLKEIGSVVCNPIATEKKSKRKKSSKRKRKSSACRKIPKNSNVTVPNKLLANPENPLCGNSLTSVTNYRYNANSSEEVQHDCLNATVECKLDNDIIEKPLLSPPTDNVKDSQEERSLAANMKPLLNVSIPPAMNSSPSHMVVATASEVTTVSELEPTYQKETQQELSLQLCPKTGLFLPNNSYVAEDINDGNMINESQQSGNVPRPTICLNHIQKKEQIYIDLDKVITENKNQSLDDNTESLEAKTKNLKDLLDDADLLQHCDDNANSDSELIDTLVKTSCENNLIQANEIIAKGVHIDHLQQKSMLNSTNELVVQLITDVSDPPKCLSFNEAGEIEGFNGELFQANSYMDTFEKQPTSVIMTDTQILPLHASMPVVTSAISVPQQSANCDESIPAIMEMIDISKSSNVAAAISLIEDSPKDLSYKKREEVCPPSESRSQCAVTSSSDVIKSPQHDDTSALATSSDTLKNLILEQFMKLNALSNNHQKDPIDLGSKQRQPDIALSNVSMYSGHTIKSGPSSSFIETVVIDDDDDDGCRNIDLVEDEPLKKRIRLNTAHSYTTNSVENVNVKAKMVMMDTDPDPLTQLRLLIRNTQWKVPDPILVPKDRLSAVLASPAREIPLLITTRPELRLPEAFAYPEIIQNPNILVISMAQLEAILQNEVEMSKEPRTTNSGPKADMTSPEQQTVVQLAKQMHDFQAAQNRRHQIPAKKTNLLSSNSISQEQKDDILEAETTMTVKKDESAKCSHIESSLASNINTATMAVLNQMLWLPYFGQISQDIMKSLKNPIALQQKCAANLMPFYSSQLSGLQNLEELYKSNNIMSQIPHNEAHASTGMQQNSNDELILFQKIVQHQMHNVLHLNQLKSADTSQRTAAASKTKATTTNPLQSSIETTTSHIESLSNFIEHKKQKNVLTAANDNHKTTNPLLSTSKTCAESGISNNMNTTEKSYNLRSSVANRQPSESKQYSSSFSNNQRQNTENKPRLTCKSLSNLLDPEHSHQHNMGSSSSASASTTYASNLTADFLIPHTHSFDCKHIGWGEGRTAGGVSSEVSMVPPSSARSVCNISNASSMEATTDFSKQHKAKASFGDNIGSENTFGNNDASVLSTETNVPLWHPLFGSNSKSAYSSPWQWTTVTATGE